MVTATVCNLRYRKSLILISILMFAIASHSAFASSQKTIILEKLNQTTKATGLYRGSLPSELNTFLSTNSTTIELSEIRNITGVPMLMDVNKDNAKDLIVTIGNLTYALDVLNSTHAEILWKVRTGSVHTNYFYSDLYGDGEPELVLINDTGSLFILNMSGHIDKTITTDIQPNWLTGFDLDGDGQLEFIVQDINNDLHYVKTDGRYGSLNIDFPLSQYIDSPPIILDDDKDGSLNIILTADDIGIGGAYILSLNASSSDWTTLNGSETQLILGTVDLPIVVGNLTVDSNDYSWQRPYEFAIFLNNSFIKIGSMTSVSPYIEATLSLTWNFSNIAPIAADINGDGIDEILVFDDNDTLHCLNSSTELWSVHVENASSISLVADILADNGLEALVKTSDERYELINSTGNIKTIYNPNWNSSSVPLVSDVDGDGLNEILIFTDTGLHIFDGSSGGLDWPTIRSDIYLTNNPTLPRDFDVDGLYNPEESLYGTSKVDSDTDNDMALDYSEIYVMHTDPLLNDTDSDGLLDGWEQYYRVDYNADLNPLVNDTNNNSVSDALEDLDGDNLTNIEEQSLGTNPMLNDTDEDGLTDWFEINVTHTNPTLADTDSDGMPDGYEYEKGFNPTNSTDGDLDLDHDGLNNTQEYLHDTDPFDPDTDSDGMSDGYEVEFGLNPNDPNDALNDNDNDGLINGLEAAYGTNPNLNDTDKDGMPDGWEVGFGLNPLDGTDNTTDLDGDGLSNIVEYELGTNPQSVDSDGDGAPDKWEVDFGFNATDPYDGYNDFDKDGLTNSQEYTYGTNPLNPDTDGDGLPDGVEIEFDSNPLLKDTDGDGLSDKIEFALGTNPLINDTDGDGLTDYYEYTHGLNPLDPSNGSNILTAYLVLAIISILVLAYLFIRKI